MRLKQGAMDKATVFSDDPAATAESWVKQGARRLHVIDLNGAAAGRPKNENAIRAIAAAVGRQDTDPARRRHPRPRHHRAVPRQRRELRHHRHGRGQESRVSCTTRAPPFPGHVLVALDAKDGKVAVDGWSKMTGHEVLDLAQEVPGLRRRSDHLHRHRPRRHADRRQHRRDRRARARAVGAGHRERRASRAWTTSRRCATSSTKASPPRSPAARSTKASSISREAQKLADELAEERRREW